jgi:hypothetical protein
MLQVASEYRSFRVHLNGCEVMASSVWELQICTSARARTGPSISLLRHPFPSQVDGELESERATIYFPWQACARHLSHCSVDTVAA